MKILLLSLVSLFVLHGQLYGDVLFFKNQKYIKGRVVGQDLQFVKFEKSSGRLVSVPKSSIRKIIFIPPDEQNEQDKISRVEEQLRQEKLERERKARRVYEEKMAREK